MRIKENIKALRHWPLCGGFPGDRWIPPTNGQLRGKCFHLMTSSWIYQLKWLCVPDCAYTENMFINSIHITLYDISLTKKILYQIKRDVAVWKRLGCPQRNKRTWWQIYGVSVIQCMLIWPCHWTVHYTSLLSIIDVIPLSIVMYLHVVELSQCCFISSPPSAAYMRQSIFSQHWFR